MNINYEDIMPIESPSNDSFKTILINYSVKLIHKVFVELYDFV